MTIPQLRIKYSDTVLVRTIQEIVIQGADAVANSDPQDSHIANKIKSCAQDMRNMNYKDFRTVIKQIL